MLNVCNTDRTHDFKGSCVYRAAVIFVVFQASDHNDAGEYSRAKDCGVYALCCNIFSVVYFGLIIVGGLAALAIYLTIGFGFITDAFNKACHTSCDYNIAGESCTTIC